MIEPAPTAAEADRLLAWLDGFAVSQIVAAAAQLEVADHLGARSLTAEQLAELTSTQIDPLRRLMQAWCALGLLRPDPVPGHYRATATLALLGRDAELSGIARLFGGAYYRAWGELLHTVRTGRSAFEHQHGTSLWGYLAAHEHAAQAFGQAMAFNAQRSVIRILERYDFARYRMIVDVGSASGELLAAVLARCPAARGLAFDLPRVAEQSATVFAPRGLAHRCEIVSGDFFEAVPTGGDLYVLKAVLHNWDDERALQILRNCRTAMAPGSRLLIIENTAPDRDGELPGVMRDLWMMVLFGGRNRPSADYVKLLARAGFVDTTVIPGPGEPVLIEAGAQ